jgi:hypothetical protein
MNWKHPLVGFVEAIVVLWLYEIFFRPRESSEADGCNAPATAGRP